MSFTNLLNNVFNIRRPNRTGDGQGGFSTTYPIQETTRGRLRPANANDATIGEKWDASISHVLYAPFGVDVKRDDLVELQSVDHFRVIAVRQPSYARRHLEIDLEQIQEVPPWQTN